MKTITVLFQLEIEVGSTANYIAMDQDGCIFGYEDKPTYSSEYGEWSSDIDSFPKKTRIVNPENQCADIRNSSIESTEINR